MFERRYGFGAYYIGNRRCTTLFSHSALWLRTEHVNINNESCENNDSREFSNATVRIRELTDGEHHIP